MFLRTSLLCWIKVLDLEKKMEYFLMVQITHKAPNYVARVSVELSWQRLKGSESALIPEGTL